MRTMTPLRGIVSILATTSVLPATLLVTTAAATPAQTRKASPQASAAKSYIDGIYRDFERTGKPPANAQVFAPELASLIAKDDAIVTRTREPNLIDYVLLCSCQDVDGLKFATSVISATAKSTPVRVTASYHGKPAKIMPFNLQLTKTPVGWRVSDIITAGKNGGSLVAYLRKGLGVSVSANRPEPAQAMSSPVRSAPAVLAGAISYAGPSTYKDYTTTQDFELTIAGGTISGVVASQGFGRVWTVPVSGTYAAGVCTVRLKDDTFSGPCDAQHYAGQRLSKKGDVVGSFAFRNADTLASAAPARPTPAPTYGAPPSGSVTNGGGAVWALGRVRILVEHGGRCGPDESLGKSFCFGETITWLRRRPKQNEIDVIAMDKAYVPGSSVPYNNGQGWDVYKVSRRGDGFAADQQLHFATKVQVPQGCIYNGVAQDAWYITIAGGRRVAIEEKLYACASWNGPLIDARSADYTYVDVGSIDYTGGAQDYANTYLNQSPAPRGNGSRAKSPSPQSTAQGADYGGPQFGDNYLSGTSAEIYGSPQGDTKKATCRDEMQVNMYLARVGKMPPNPCRKTKSR